MKHIKHNGNIQEKIEVPSAPSIKNLDRWEAYMKCHAIMLGYHGRFSIGMEDGKSIITVYLPL